MTGITFLDRIPPVTRALIIINVIMWAFGALLPRADLALQNFCGLHYWQSPLFNPIQPFTYMFLHGGFFHLFFNMFSLYFFGTFIEQALSSKRFIFYYIICGIGAALCQELVYSLRISSFLHQSMYSPMEIQEIISRGSNAIRQGMNFVDPTLASFNNLYNGVTVGASGAIYGVLVAMAMIFPNVPMYIMFLPVPIKAKWAVIAFAVIELFTGISNSPSDNIAHFAHLGGMIMGALIILWWKRKRIIRTLY